MGHPPVSRSQTIAAIQRRWAGAPPWRSVRRTYAAEDVERLHRDEHGDLSAARQGAERLCSMIGRCPASSPLNAILARSSGQALEGLQSGGGDLCLVDAAQIVATSFTDSPSPLMDRIAHITLALHRAQQRQSREGIRPGEPGYVDYAIPLLANVTDCLGSALDVYQTVQGLLEAGVAGVVIDDHPGSRIGALAPPTLSDDTLVQHLTAARMAADVAASDTVLIARTCALDEDGLPASPQIAGPALDQAIERATRWAPYADIIGLRVRESDLKAATRFAREIRQRFPHKPLCYDGPPVTSQAEKRQLSALGYRFVLPSQMPAYPSAQRDNPFGTLDRAQDRARGIAAC